MPQLVDTGEELCHMGHISRWRSHSPMNPIARRDPVRTVGQGCGCPISDIFILPKQYTREHSSSPASPTASLVDLEAELWCNTTYRWLWAAQSTPSGSSSGSQMVVPDVPPHRTEHSVLALWEGPTRGSEAQVSNSSSSSTGSFCKGSCQTNPQSLATILCLLKGTVFLCIRPQNKGCPTQLSKFTAIKYTFWKLGIILRQADQSEVNEDTRESNSLTP